MRLINILTFFLLMLVSADINAQGKNCFVIGSGQNLVRNLQGVPNSIYKNGETKETWYFGKSSITFKDKMVSEYDNYGHNLKICKEVIPVMTPEIRERSGFLQPERSKSKATKADTEDWVLGKLNKYVPASIDMEGYYSAVSRTQYSGKSIRNTSFSIESGDLVVRMYVDESRNSHDESFSIPINDIKRIHSDKGQLIFTTTRASILHSGGKERERVSAFSTKFNFDEEPDIRQRLVSAFSHLQKFYKTVKKKELF